MGFPSIDFRVRHGAHEAQFFDSPVSRAAAVAGFLHEGFARGEQMLAVMLQGHWALVRERLESLGHDVTRAAARGQLTILEARDTLKRCLHDGVPDRTLVTTIFSRRLEALTAAGQGLRVYGELSDLLARDGDFQGARAMEDLSNQLRLHWPCTLFCGYSTANFASPKDRDGLLMACRAHDHVHAAPADPLAACLVTAHDGHRS